MNTVVASSMISDNSAPPNWWLSAVANLDKLAPGTCGALLRGSILRQQVAALAIATLFPLGGEAKIARASDELGRIVMMMAEGRLEAVLIASAGHCPPGILGALSRCANIQQDADFYLDLFGVFADPAQSAVAVSLRHLQIDSNRLQAAIGSPPWLLTTGILRLLHDERSRDELVRAASLVARFSGATQEEIGKSLQVATRTGRLDRWAARWVHRARLPTPPVAADQYLLPVTTCRELAALGREYRNCLNSYRLEALAGRQFFYRVSGGQCELLAQLSRASGDAPWVVTGVYRMANQSVAPHDHERVVALFAGRGLGSVPRNRLLPPDWEPLAALLDSDDAVRAEIEAMCRF